MDLRSKCFLRFVQILTSADHGAAAHLALKNATAEASCVFTLSQLHPRAALFARWTVVDMKYVRSFHGHAGALSRTTAQCPLAAENITGQSKTCSERMVLVGWNDAALEAFQRRSSNAPPKRVWAIVGVGAHSPGPDFV